MNCAHKSFNPVSSHHSFQFHPKIFHKWSVSKQLMNKHFRQTSNGSPHSLKALTTEVIPVPQSGGRLSQTLLKKGNFLDFPIKSHRISRTKWGHWFPSFLVMLFLGGSWTWVHLYRFLNSVVNFMDIFSNYFFPLFILFGGLHSVSYIVTRCVCSFIFFLLWFRVWCHFLSLFYIFPDFISLLFSQHGCVFFFNYCYALASLIKAF